jgi:inorganic phosphate transporter, PiT family
MRSSARPTSSRRSSSRTADAGTSVLVDVELTIVAVIAVALFFDFTNGFHDAANAIATSVSTRAVPPRVAVLGAAVLNFAGAFASFEVAATIAKGIVDAEVITEQVVLAGVVGAITWNLFTWYLGLPTSSSHALIGGALGAAIAANGFGVVLVDGVVQKVLIPSLASPTIGIVLGGAIALAIMWIFQRARPTVVNRVFRRLQVVSAAFVAFTHGTNDAQKTMGIMTLALVASGHVDADFERPPTWVIVAAAAAMGLGTYAGGWRIIRTLGQRVVHLEPYQGFAAETATATILYTTANAGFPVSTTHTISGSVLGAGAARRFSAVRWGLAGNILVAWVFTIPCAGAVAAALELLVRVPAGEALVTAFVALIAILAFGARGWEMRRGRAGTVAAPVAPPP